MKLSIVIPAIAISEAVTLKKRAPHSPRSPKHYYDLPPIGPPPVLPPVPVGYGMYGQPMGVYGQPMYGYPPSYIPGFNPKGSYK
jgi:hypothetical protein